jgi:hypothetical protein
MMELRPATRMRHEDVPCWHELSWDQVNTEIVIRIHRDVLKQNYIIDCNSPMVRSIMKDIGNPYFEGNLYKDFGFGGFWKDVSNRGFVGDFLEIIFKIPKYTTTTCFYCDETGECKFHEKNNEFSFVRAYNISASWVVLCNFLRVCTTETSCDKAQLMMISPIVKRNMHGGSLNCLLSKGAVDWLSLIQGSDSNIVEVVEAMEKAYSKIFGPYEYTNTFYAMVQNEGRLIMQCPGDACDLAPEEYAMEGKGYQLWPHNIDTPFQQMTFFAGLAALHDKIRNG